MHKILNYLGLAKRSGHIIVGTDGVLENVRQKKIYMIFVASDASLATIEKVVKKGAFYQIPVINIFSTDELSTSIGSLNAKVIGINDPGFTKAIHAEIERGD